MLPFYESNNKKFSCFTSNPLAYPLRFHTEVELLFVVRGSVEVEIEGGWYRMNAGDFAAIFPGQLHQYQCRSGQSLGLLALFHPELTPDFSAALTDSHPQTPILRKEQLHPDIELAMKRLLAEFRAPCPNEFVYPIFSQLALARCFPSLHLIKKAEVRHSNLLYQLVEFLAAHFDQPLTLSDVADACGVSKYHLSRVFSQQMHLSFPAYLNTLRINEAQRQLRTTQLAITDISYLCGFDSPRSFNRNFIRIAGMTPREYRNRRVWLQNVPEDLSGKPEPTDNLQR